jgi:two-component system sensor histidine kinase KdpD
MGSDASGAAAVAAGAPKRTRFNWRGHAATVALAAAATGIGVFGRRQLALPDIVTLYLLTIMVAASLFGRGPALLASTVSVLAYDFFFIPPFFTFVVDDQRHLLTFAMMFVVGLLFSSLTQRVRRNEQRANDALLRARTEEMRSALLSAVSHDLRTPLAAITGAASTLRERAHEATDVEKADLLDTIREEADRLERLVRNLLDMTRLESGALHVKREWVPLEEIIGAALTRLEGQIADRPVRTELPVNLPLLSVDGILLEQLFVNLLENAAKYTPSGSAVDVTARVFGDSIVVEVADRGPGLPPGSEKRIFEKFYRGRQVERPGAGLGLAICLGIAEAHGGSIVAENRPGSGAIFRVTLPQSELPPSVPSEADPDALTHATGKAS